MSKELWKAGNMLYPVPVVMVSCGTMEESNIITVAWTGTINTNPPMTYVSVRPERHSYNIIKETGEFVINVTTEALAYATDWCGVRSGSKYDKFKEMKLTKEECPLVSCPAIAESPMNIMCKVKEIVHLGSHDMFLAKVTAVQVDESLLDEKGKLDLNRAHLVAYSHGEYQTFDNILGTFGYSVKKNNKRSRK